MTRYLLLLAADQSEWDDAGDAERAAVMQAHADFDAAVRERAVLVAGEALTGGADAHTLRPGEDGRTLTEGPFAEAAEDIGGFYLVDAPDLDTMVELAQILPASYTIEIRPAVDISGYDYGDRP